MVVAGFKNKQQIIIISIFQRCSFRSIDIIQIAIGRRNIIIVHKINLTFIVDIFSIDFLLFSVCPHTPFTVRTSRHIRFQLFNTIFRITSFNGFFFAFNNQLNIFLRLLYTIFIKNNNICTRFA